MVILYRLLKSFEGVSVHKPVGVSLAHDSLESYWQAMMISAKTSPKVKGDGEWLYDML